MTTYFDQNITEVVIDAATGDIIEGATAADITEKELEDLVKLPLYTWVENGAVEKYAFHSSGLGLWSTVHSYLALEKDLNTIIGATFYGHAETPGLGAECSEPWFQEQFKGKKVLSTDGTLTRFRIVKGGVPGGHPNCVDGISAATMTSVGIEDFLNIALEKYESYFSKVRGS